MSKDVYALSSTNCLTVSDHLEIRSRFKLHSIFLWFSFKESFAIICVSISFFVLLLIFLQPSPVSNYCLHSRKNPRSIISLWSALLQAHGKGGVFLCRRMPPLILEQQFAIDYHLVLSPKYFHLS